MNPLGKLSAGEREGGHPAEAQRGSALVWAMLFVIVTASVVISHSTFMAANRREMDIQYRTQRLSGSFARSGLTDALAWFRRQPTQPVNTFAPQHDPSRVPPIVETLDPTLGLVREFEVRGNLWGRYEVRKGETHDVSSQRGHAAPGTVWDVGARGYLYRQVDPNVPFDQEPNRIVAVGAVRTEVRGIPLLPPGSSAVAIPDRSDVTVLGGGSINSGGVPGILHGALQPFPIADIIGVTGTPDDVMMPGFDISPVKVFSAKLAELESLSDVVVNGAADLPPSLPRDGIVFVAGDLVLPSGANLRGRVVLVVGGNLTAQDGNDTRISGLIYVVGDATIRGPFRLDGQIIVGGTLTVGGGAGATALIEYDSLSVDAVKTATSRYRMSRKLRPVAMEGGGGGIDPTANVEDSVTMGSNVSVGPLSHIWGSTTIGNDVSIGASATIEGVTIGSNVSIRDSVRIDPTAIIEDNVTIATGVSIGAGAHIHARSFVPAGTTVAAGDTTTF